MTSRPLNATSAQGVPAPRTLSIRPRDFLRTIDGTFDTTVEGDGESSLGSGKAIMADKRDHPPSFQSRSKHRPEPTGCLRRRPRQTRLPFLRPRPKKAAIPVGNRFKRLSDSSGEECARELLRWARSLRTRAQRHFEPRKLAGSDAVRLLRRDATILKAFAEQVALDYLSICQAATERRRQEDLNVMARLDRDVHEGMLYSDYAAAMAAWDQETAGDANGAFRG